MVQMIFALRVCSGSAGHAEGACEFFSIIEVVSGSEILYRAQTGIVVVGRCFTVGSGY